MVKIHLLNVIKINMRNIFSYLIKTKSIYMILMLFFIFYNPVLSKTTSNKIVSDISSSQLVIENNKMIRGQAAYIDFKIILKDGWHTYWINPGDSGYPLMIDWDLPPGIDIGPINWPAPKRLPYGGLTNFGFSNEVTFASSIKVSQQASLGNKSIVARANWLVCNDICIPEEGEFKLDISILDKQEQKKSTNNQQNYSKERNFSIPKELDLVVDIIHDENFLEIHIPFKSNLDSDLKSIMGINKINDLSFNFFPYQKNIIINNLNQEISIHQNIISIKIKTKTDKLADIPIGGVITINGQQGNYINSFKFPNTIVRTSEKSKIEEPDNKKQLSFLLAFLFAIIGGLILNLMPCVLPVLSLKIISIINKKDIVEARKEAIAYSFGVILSFAFLSTMLIFLKLNNQGVGWGFQLQSAYFVTVLSYVMLASGLSLSGVFNFGSSLMNLGSSLNTQKGIVGSFLTGILATVVASPCTAPFMAPAIGYALSENVFVTLFVFQGLALGLSAPFLLIAFFPPLFRFLPRPGEWMNTLKEFLAFPMYAACGWLIWVGAQLTGSSGLGIIIFGILLVSISCWLFGRKIERNLLRLTINITIALLLSLALIIPLNNNFNKGSEIDTGSLEYDISEEFSQEYLEILLEEKKPVLINFTAAWCITCIVNEKNVLSDYEVIESFRNNGVTYLKADWTKRSKKISKVIESYNRSGIPLYVLYKGDGSYKLLNQILTKKGLINEIEKARLDSI